MALIGLHSRGATLGLYISLFLTLGLTVVLVKVESQNGLMERQLVCI